MLPEYNPLPKFPDNSKAGVTVRLNHKDNEEPFEATIFFSKSGKSTEELKEKDAINITASGKLRLDIGENGFVEIFAENTCRLKEAGAKTQSGTPEEETDNEMSLL
jgi:hypothetical protein